MSVRAQRSRGKKIKGLTGQLVSHILGFKSGEENHEIAVDFSLENFEKHRFADTEWQEVTRNMNGLVEKMTIHNNVMKAQALKRAFEKYQESIPQSLNPDEHYNILRLLVLMSSTRTRRRLRDENEDSRVLQDSTAQPTEKIGIDPEVVRLEKEWEQEYQASLYERETGFTEEYEFQLASIIAAEERGQTEEDPMLYSAEEPEEQAVDTPAEDIGGTSVLFQALTHALSNDSFLTSDDGWGGEEEGVIYDDKDRLQRELGRQKEGVRSRPCTTKPTTSKPWNNLQWKLRQMVADSLAISSKDHGLKSLYLADPRQVSEAYLVRQVVQLLHGIQGDVFRLDADSRMFAYNHSISLTHVSHQSLSSTLAFFVKGANEQRRLRQFIEQRTSNHSRAGRCYQAFCEGLAKILDLDRCLARYETLINDPSYDQPVTLISLRNVLTAELDKQAFLHDLTSHLTDHAPRADQLLSTLHKAFTHYAIIGHTRQTSVLGELLVCSLSPYLEMLHKWTTEGVVEDPYGEFMVQQAREVDSRSAQYWSAAFVVRTCREGNNQVHKS